MLDTHAAGMDEPQAEVIVDVIRMAIPDALATKALDFLIGP